MQKERAHRAKLSYIIISEATFQAQLLLQSLTPSIVHLQAASDSAGLEKVMPSFSRQLRLVRWNKRCLIRCLIKHVG